MYSRKGYMDETYEILGYLGSGSGGVIYKAYHKRLQKEVVLKKIKRKSRDARINRNEVDILKNLNHMYLPQVVDFFEENGEIYTAMSFIPGRSLKENGSSQDDKKTISSETYQKVYGPLLDQAGNEYGQSMDYFLYDIDKDGVKELLLLNGTCEADYVYKIYTIGNGSARYIDEVNGSCVMFYEDENGGTEKYIISVQARMGCERVSKIWLKDGKVSTEEISYKEEVGIDEDYYSNPYPLDYADVTDKSLLK